MTALAITPEILVHITQAVERARLHPIVLNEEDMEKLAAFKESIGTPHPKVLALDDRPKDWQRSMASEAVVIPMGYTAAVSFEQQPEPLGLCMHLSISVDNPGRVPHPVAVDMLAKAFGMHYDNVYPRHLWPEEFEPGHIAINILEPVEWPRKSS